MIETTVALPADRNCPAVQGLKQGFAWQKSKYFDKDGGLAYK